MDFDLKLTILKSGKRQWEIAQKAGISESKLSKHLHGYAPLNDTERERLDWMRC
jgi:DNA-binding CsgD family transcriptional regulator